MTKQDLLNMVQALPDDAPFDKLAVELERVRFVAEVQHGLDAIERGETVSNEEALKVLRKWRRE